MLLFRLDEVNWLKVAEKTLALLGGVVAYQGGGRRTGTERGESGNSLEIIAEQRAVMAELQSRIEAQV